MRIICAFLGMSFFLFTGCSPCKNLFGSILNPEKCTNLGLSFSKTRIGLTASCVGVPNSRKISINCPPTVGYCKSPSQGSLYYFVVMPNNAGGAFEDSSAGLISSCVELWNALLSATPPTDILGGYYASASAGDGIACTDVGGCTTLSTGCVSGWDSGTGAPGGTAISLPNGTSLLTCGFLDVPLTNGSIGGVGPPPTQGFAQPSTSASTAFAPLVVLGNLSFTSWEEY